MRLPVLILVLMLLLSLGISGCQAQVTALTTIEDDGSGSSSLRLSVGPELAELLEEGGAGRDIFEPISEGLEGWKVESGREPDGTRWLHATREFDSLQELRGREGDASAASAAFAASDASDGGPGRVGVSPLLDWVRIWTTSDPFTERFHFEAQMDVAGAVGEIAAGTPELGQLETYRDALVVEQRLRLPGSLREHNADEVLDGELVWRPDLQGPATLRAVSERYRWEWLAPLVALAIVNLMAVGAVAYRVLAARR